MESHQKSITESISHFIRESVSIKILTIFILSLLLMIPMEFVGSLIHERESLRQSAVNEVNDIWARRQSVYGPVLTLPINKEVIEDGKVKVVRENAYILPTQLNVIGGLKPQKLKRSIYEVVVYDSRLTFNGDFNNIGKYIDNLSDYEILWDKAFLTINISDLRGVKNRVIFNWNNTEYPVEAGSLITGLVNTGITINNIAKDSSDINNSEFSFTLDIQGSEYLGFVPLGKETNVTLNSDWQDPSFTGSFIPDDRKTGKDGFDASYKILEINRSYPQFWVGERNIESIFSSEFGVNLLLPMNDYQKATRSTKYAILAIMLTFLTFFLSEVFNKKGVHPFQYILIGLALVLFYTLLVAISEHTNFDIAYLISSISIIAMIVLYSYAVLRSVRQFSVLAGILILTYSFVYITLQLQTYALLIGSVGLTAILALTMYITRNINWYELNSETK